MFYYVGPLWRSWQYCGWWYSNTRTCCVVRHQSVSGWATSHWATTTTSSLPTDGTTSTFCTTCRTRIWWRLVWRAQTIVRGYFTASLSSRSTDWWLRPLWMPLTLLRSPHRLCNRHMHYYYCYVLPSWGESSVQREMERVAHRTCLWAENSS